jgi:hypothetical protein
MHGDGKTDDSSAIRAALGELRAGETLHLQRPSVAYAFNEPVIVPPGVQIVGDDMMSTSIWGLPNFPPGRDIFEFKTGGKTTGNRIANMTIRPAPVDGCGGISYRPVDPNSTAERWHGTLENIRFEGSNSFNPYCINIGGNVHSSRFINLWGDPSRRYTAGHSPTYDTVLLKFGDGQDAGLDIAGAYCCVIEGLTCTPVRGGFCAAIRGALTGCTVQVVSVGLGTKGAPYLDLRNCNATTISNVMIEGGGGRPMIRLEKCRYVEIIGIAMGNPARNDAVITTLGNGIELIDCSNVTIKGAARWTTNPSWSHLNYPTEPAESKFIADLDADCINCEIHVDCGNIDTVAAVRDLGVNNHTRVRNPYTRAAAKRTDGVVT